jgi:hypothetical protein
VLTLGGSWCVWQHPLHFVKTSVNEQGAVIERHLFQKRERGQASNFFLCGTCETDEGAFATGKFIEGRQVRIVARGFPAGIGRHVLTWVSVHARAS